LVSDDPCRKPEDPVAGNPELVLPTHVRPPDLRVDVPVTVDLDMQPVPGPVRVQIPGPTVLVRTQHLLIGERQPEPAAYTAKVYLLPGRGTVDRHPSGFDHDPPATGPGHPINGVEHGFRAYQPLLANGRDDRAGLLVRPCPLGGVDERPRHSGAGWSAGERQILVGKQVRSVDPDTGGTAPICASVGRNQHIDGTTERASKATRDRSGEPAENRAGPAACTATHCRCTADSGPLCATTTPGTGTCH
jgi:hypothetical protein